MSSSHHPSTQRFRAGLDQQWEMHLRKQKDYGSIVDPFANVRASEKFGVPGWAGAILRANDKMVRLQKAISQVLRGEEINMANEGVEDSILDLAVYANIALAMFKEWTADRSVNLPDLARAMDEAERTIEKVGPLNNEDRYVFNGPLSVANTMGPGYSK
jgi:hypothetical protein